MLDAITLQFVGVSGAEDFIARDLGGDDLTYDIAVGKSNDEAVLGGIVFVLGLGNETLSCVVIGFSSPTTLVLGLVAAAGL